MDIFTANRYDLRPVTVLNLANTVKEKGVNCGHYLISIFVHGHFVLLKLSLFASVDSISKFEEEEEKGHVGNINKQNVFKTSKLNTDKQNVS